jgi:hypothetical protein
VIAEVDGDGVVYNRNRQATLYVYIEIDERQADDNWDRYITGKAHSKGVKTQGS